MKLAVHPIAQERRARDGGEQRVLAAQQDAPHR
jgi:hypothetical protein